MMEPRLQNRLAGLAHMRKRVRLHWCLARCWAVAAAIGLSLLLVQSLTSRELPRKLWLLPIGVGVALSTYLGLRHRKRAVEVRELIRQLEQDQPEIRHLLSAAAEQQFAERSGGLSFLQVRVIEEALAHPWEAVWRERLTRRLALARAGHASALFVLVAAVLGLNWTTTHHESPLGRLLGEELTVTPGDVQVERGTGLVIAARFGSTPPAEASLVIRAESGKQVRLQMARRLADPVFGAAISEVSEAGIYHIEYGTKKSRDYKIRVFEFPALVRADAELQYPAYTGLTNRTIRDTVRVSAVEGSRLTYTLQLNKPVKSARLVAQEQSLALETSNNAVAVLPNFLLTNSARYSLVLLDGEGRSNRFATEFVLQALTNQRPQVKLVFPRGDPRVSPLQELQLQAEAVDDFGLLKYGIGFGVAGQEPRFVELGQAAPANTKRQFEYLLSLEKLGVDVDQALGYFAWADDYGPDGRPRRTFSDMFFAEVRPFEEVFRADQSGGGESGQGGQSGGQDRIRLAELQKQIVVATWNLERQKSATGGPSHP
jgi:hypothetical protein